MATPFASPATIRKSFVADLGFTCPEMQTETLLNYGNGKVDHLRSFTADISIDGVLVKRYL